MRKILTLILSVGILAVVLVVAKTSAPKENHFKVQPAVLAETVTNVPTAQTVSPSSVGGASRFTSSPLNPVNAVATPIYPMDAFAQRVFTLTNAQRTARGLRPLILNTKLINAAGWFAHDMAVHQVRTLSHTDSLGRTPGTRLRAFGYYWTWFGENIAMGYTMPSAVVAAWMASPGHRANILNPHFIEIGIGHAVGGGTDYWVQDFGRR